LKAYYRSHIVFGLLANPRSVLKSASTGKRAMPFLFDSEFFYRQKVKQQKVKQQKVK
jgi:hypothetical protein